MVIDPMTENRLGTLEWVHSHREKLGLAKHCGSISIRQSKQRIHLVPGQTHVQQFSEVHSLWHV